VVKVKEARGRKDYLEQYETKKKEDHGRASATTAGGIKDCALEK